jgi:hypothetical protein
MFRFNGAILAREMLGNDNGLFSALATGLLQRFCIDIGVVARAVIIVASIALCV